MRFEISVSQTDAIVNRCIRGSGSRLHPELEFYHRQVAGDIILFAVIDQNNILAIIDLVTAGHIPRISGIGPRGRSSIGHQIRREITQCNSHGAETGRGG